MGGLAQNGTGFPFLCTGNNEELEELLSSGSDLVIVSLMANTATVFHFIKAIDNGTRTEVLLCHQQVKFVRYLVPETPS